jgi:hypothetical protein
VLVPVTKTTVTKTAIDELKDAKVLSNHRKESVNVVITHPGNPAEGQ